MLSEGRRDGLRLALSRSLSEPGVPIAMPVSFHSEIEGSSPSLLLAPPQVVSLPCSPCSDSTTIQRSLLLRRARVMEPVEVVRRLTKTQKGRNFLLLDLRSFVSFNMNHIRSAINLNCSDRINRRRLLQRRATVVDLAVSPTGRDILKKRCFKEVIVYDDCTTDIESLPPQHPVFLVLTALLEDNRDPVVLKGGFQSFERSYPELCEDALMRSKVGEMGEDALMRSKMGEMGEDALMRSKMGEMDAEDIYTDPSTDSSSTFPWDLQSIALLSQSRGGSIPASPTGSVSATIEEAPVSQVLPFLYLGNAKDAQDIRLLEGHGISRVLNVTSQSPLERQDRTIEYKTLPAVDSGHQNLRQYFDEAIGYIDEARQVGGRILVHCQAGVSRSPTIVLAYLMKHTRMTMLEAYKLVKSRRPIISPNLNFMGQLVEWEATLQASKTEPDCKPCHQCQWQRQESKSVPSVCQV